MQQSLHDDSAAVKRARRFSVAPMMDWTDRHCRFLHRLLTREALLFTEMVTSAAIVHGDPVRHLRFDPAVLQVVDAAPATPGVQIEPLGSFFSPGFVIKKKACNEAVAGDPDCPTAGLAWYAAAQLNPAPPVSGSGPLARIAFRAVKAGISPLIISYQKFSDISGAVIPSDGIGGSVIVTGAPPTVTARARHRHPARPPPSSPPRSRGSSLPLRPRRGRGK